MDKRTCDVEGCESKHYGKGLCLSHYARMASRRRRDPEAFAVFQVELTAKRARRAAQDAATEKPCTKCGVVQPKSEFSPATRSSDGLHGWCKSCCRALRAAKYDPEADARWRAERKSRPGYKLTRRAGYGRRRANKQGAHVTKTNYAAIITRDGMVCHICSGEIESLADLHMDHIVPLSKGGPHTAANISPSHAQCNMRKGARLIA